MLRLITLLVAFALMFNNGTTVALAMCQHGDSQAHVSARSSVDAQVSSSAIAEEAAERSISHSKTFSDGSPASVVAFVLASNGLTLGMLQRDHSGALPVDDQVPPSGSIAPPLRPPLG